MTEAIKKLAIIIFTQFVNAKECFITPDEQAFLVEDRARMHSKDYVTVKRSDVEVPTEEKTAAKTAAKPAVEKPTAKPAAKPAAATPAKKTAEELIADMPKVETLEALEALAKGEKRATVKAAIEARRTELTPNETK